MKIKRYLSLAPALHRSADILTEQRHAMTQSTNDRTQSKNQSGEGRQSIEYNRTLTQIEALRTRSEFTSMKLTPWDDIWTSLMIARLRGNGRMVQVFYDTLFKEAVFDDRGAWYLNDPRQD